MWAQVDARHALALGARARWLQPPAPPLLGVHHHFSSQYLHQYAGEMVWRKDNRRVYNGEQYLTVSKLALAHPVSRDWKGYWQR